MTKKRAVKKSTGANKLQITSVNCLTTVVKPVPALVHSSWQVAIVYDSKNNVFVECNLQDNDVLSIENGDTVNWSSFLDECESEQELLSFLESLTKLLKQS